MSPLRTRGRWLTAKLTPATLVLTSSAAALSTTAFCESAPPRPTARSSATRPCAQSVDDALERASKLVADAADPVEDANGSVEYKRHLVAVLSRRIVLAAVADAQGGKRSTARVR